MSERPVVEGAHPTPNVSKITVGGGFAGLLITVSTVGIFLIGIPATRVFLAASLVLGIGVAAILHWTARDR
jgi:hypothetical protein